MESDGKISYVTNKEGELYSVPDSEFQDALNKGWQPASDEQINQHREKQAYTSGLNPLGAAGLEFANASTLGLSNLALEKLGLISKEKQEKLREYNPTETIIGGISSLFTGNPLGLLGKIGIGAKAVGALGFGEKVGQGLSERILSKAISHGTEGALQGAAYSGATSVTDSLLNDSELSGELLMSHLGMGALLGGGLSAGIGTIGGLLPKPKGSISESIFHQARQSSAGTLAKLSSIATGSDEQALKKFYGMNKEELERFTSPDSVDKISNQFTEKLSDKINEFEKLSPEIEKYAIGAHKRSQIKNFPMKSFYRIASKEAENILNKISSMINIIPEKGASHYGRQAEAEKILNFTDSSLKKIQKISKREDKSLVAADIFNELDAYKKRIGSISKPGEIIGETRPEHLSTEIFRDVYNVLLPHLENEKIYGIPAATAQKMINQKWHAYLGGDFKFKNFITKMGQIGFEPIFGANRHSIKTLINNLDNAAYRDELEQFYGHVIKRMAVADTLSEHLKLPKIAIKKLDNQRKLSQEILDILSSAKKDMGILNDFKNISQRGSPQSAIGAAVKGGTFLGGVGLVSGGAAGALIGGGAGLLGGALYDLVTQPGQSLRKLAAIERITSHASNRINKFVDSILSEKTSKISKDLERGIRQESIISNIKSKDEDYKKKLDILSQYITDPNSLQEKITHMLSEVEGVDPAVSSAIAVKMAQAANFLYEKAPKDPNFGKSLTPMANKWNPTKLQMISFNRYEKAFQNPFSILEDFENGNLSDESVEAFRLLYPKQQQYIASKIVDKASQLGHKIFYKKKLLLSKFLGYPLDDSMKPDIIQSIQEGYANPEMNDNKNNSGQHSKINPEKISERFQTNNQRIQKNS